MQKIGLEIFVALGGMGLIYTAARKGIPYAVGAAADWLFSHPAVKSVVIAHASDIKQAIKDSEIVLEEKIDAQGKNS